MEPWYFDVIRKQLSSKMTSFGFANDLRSSGVSRVDNLSQYVAVYKVVPVHKDVEKIFVLVVWKTHKPQGAHQVVDFRIGKNIYSTQEIPC